MFKRYGTCMLLCLCFLLIGILIGGCIEAKSPRPNHIHLTVMKYHEVNVSPEVGDIIDWKAYDKSQSLTVQFSDTAPCDEGNGKNTCHFNTTNGSGIFTYNCTAPGQATCPDPGVGPPGGETFVGVQGAFPHFLDSLVKLFDRFVLKIDSLFILQPASVYAKSSPTPSQQNSHAPAPTNTGHLPAQPVSNVGPYTVSCSGNNTTVTKSGAPITNITANPGDQIIWTSTNYKFTLTMPSNFCQEATSPSDYSQQCTLLNSVTPGTYNYAATVDNCNATQQGSETITVPQQ